MSACRRLQRNTPCPECPWRRDAPVGHFPADRYRALAGTSTQSFGTLFACHLSEEGNDLTCAGYLAVAGATSIRVRLAVSGGHLDLTSIADAAPNFPPMYGSFAEMAVANGVPAGDPTLDDPDLWTGFGPLATEGDRHGRR